MNDLETIRTTIPIVSIVGRSGAGKTTLLEKLIRELKRRGIRVATVKHHAHAGFEIDKPGKDTWRHAQAGSDQVVLAAADKVAAIHYVDHPMTLDEIATKLIRGVDIILTDGFGGENKPKIEVVRASLGLEPISNAAELLAVVVNIDLPDAETPVGVKVPHFGFGDTISLVDLIEERFIKTGRL